MKKKIKGSPYRPRLSVFRSNQHIHVQVIDDSISKTIFSYSTLELHKNEKIENTKNCLASEMVGKKIASILLKNNIKKVVFDRGIKPYHGRIKAVADGARIQGLEF